MSNGEATHLLQEHDDDARFEERLARWVGAGLGAGETVLAFLTDRRRTALERRLLAHGLDTAALRAARRFVVGDAHETLAALERAGHVDETRFAEVVVGPVASAVAGAPVGVRVFDELPALLAATGRGDEAARLERLWEDVLRARPHRLLCACARTSAGGTRLVEVGGRYDAAARPVGRLGGELQLRAIVDASPLPLVVVAPDSTVRLWNPAAERLFGWRAEEVLERPLPIVPPENGAEHAALRRALTGGEPLAGIETVHRARDGRDVPVCLSAASLHDDAGDVAGTLLVFEDDGPRRRAEAERAELLARAERAREQAEAASRAKDEFLAVLGHELRTPLSAIRNALVAARLEPTRRERAVDIARRQADQLARLVDDLLDVARITQGKIRLRMQRCRVSAIVERAMEAARPLLEERAHAVYVTVPDDTVQVEGDPTRLEQVLVNLVSNAAKYTAPGGRIAVTASLEDAEVVVRVRDNGVGIAPEKLSRVFDLFAQADRASDRTQDGLGIGLTVVRRLVELHGGRVEAHSEGPGRGAEFVVRLPAMIATTAASAAHPAGTLPQPERRPVRILLVEDNADAAESLTMLLELLGHRVQCATDGLTALEAARATPPDVMLVDIGLPDMDGYELARRLRREAHLARVRLVALTGYAREEDRRQALEAGFDHHLVKPVDVETLQGIVSSVSSAPPASLALH